MPKSPLLRIYCVWMLLYGVGFIGYVLSRVLPHHDNTHIIVFDYLFYGLYFGQLQLLAGAFVALKEPGKLIIYTLLPYYSFLAASFWNAVRLRPDPYPWSVREIGTSFMVNALGLTIFFLLLCIPYVLFLMSSYQLRHANNPDDKSTPDQFSLRSFFYLTVICAMVAFGWRFSLTKYGGVWVVLDIPAIMLLPVAFIIAFCRHKLDWLTVWLIAGATFLYGTTIFNSDQHKEIESICLLCGQYTTILTTSLALRWSGFRLTAVQNISSSKKSLPIILPMRNSS